MNLLTYTKKLVQQIAYYDNITKGKYNPFFKPVEITIVWIENEKEKI